MVQPPLQTLCTEQAHPRTLAVLCLVTSNNTVHIAPFYLHLNAVYFRSVQQGVPLYHFTICQ